MIGTFNTLINELQSSYKKLKDFGQNASHELKTPLTIMRGEIEIGLRKERSIVEYQDILHSVFTELNLLQETIEKILFLSSHSDAQLKKTFSDIYFDEVIAEVISEKQLFAKQYNIQLQIKTIEPTTVVGNFILLKILCANLIENAIKYSYAEGIIELSLIDRQFIVEDFGVGIDVEDQEAIFERFYRVDKVRNHAKGSGLGLSIVKSILDLHKFPIEVISTKGKGTKMIVTFPL